MQQKCLGTQSNFEGKPQEVVLFVPIGDNQNKNQ